MKKRSIPSLSAEDDYKRSCERLTNAIAENRRLLRTLKRSMSYDVTLLDAASSLIEGHCQLLSRVVTYMRKESTRTGKATRRSR